MFFLGALFVLFASRAPTSLLATGQLIKRLVDQEQLYLPGPLADAS